MTGQLAHLRRIHLYIRCWIATLASKRLISLHIGKIASLNATPSGSSPTPAGGSRKRRASKELEEGEICANSPLSRSVSIEGETESHSTSSYSTSSAMRGRGHEILQRSILDHFISLFSSNIISPETLVDIKDWINSNTARVEGLQSVTTLVGAVQSWFETHQRIDEFWDTTGYTGYAGGWIAHLQTRRKSGAQWQKEMWVVMKSFNDLRLWVLRGPLCQDLTNFNKKLASLFVQWVPAGECTLEDLMIGFTDYNKVLVTWFETS